MPRQTYSIGEKIGRLKIIGNNYRDIGKNGRVVKYVVCLCDCGKTTETTITKMHCGHTRSCGCLNDEAIYKHGMTGTPEHRTWSGVVGRCYNKKNSRYHRYGGRGISCEWESFEDFYKDMGRRPAGTSLDRIDNNKGYSKKNCRWATPKEQMNNTGRNVYIKYKDKKQTIAMWSRDLNIEYCTLIARIKRGWTTERAFNTPTGGIKNESS